MFERLPLKDIHLPDPVSWWPPAIGWWLMPIILILFVPLLRVVVRAMSRYLQNRRLRRQVLQELELIQQEFDTNRNIAGALEKVSSLLRRVAITVCPERAVAGRTGEAWVDWLRGRGADRQDPEIFTVLTRAPYQRAPEIEMQRLFKAVERWVRSATRGHHSSEGAT